MSRGSKSFLLMLLILMMASCHDPEPEPMICNCDAKVSSSFEEVQGIMVNTTDGYMFLSPFIGYFEICNGLDVELEIDGLMVTTSGELKSTCLNEFEVDELSFVNLDNWTIAVDSLFNQFPIKIKVFKSEFPGYDPGFGYDVETADGGFHIRQTFLPAIGGKKPFKTETDAFKTAMLVAYKLNSDSGLPALTVLDLQFLKVLY